MRRSSSFVDSFVYDNASMFPDHVILTKIFGVQVTKKKGGAFVDRIVQMRSFRYLGFHHFFIPASFSRLARARQ